MKKILALILALVLLTTTLSIVSIASDEELPSLDIQTYPSPPEYYDAEDAVAIALKVVGYQVIDEVTGLYFDVNNDGTINILDAIFILQYNANKNS